MVGLIAPSDFVSGDYGSSLEDLRSWGLKYKLGKFVNEKIADFMAGTAEQRQQDLLEMIYDDEVKAIWSLSGGYCASDVLPVFTEETKKHLRENPKWFLGYSDSCALLNALTSFGITNIHSPNFWSLKDWDLKSQEWLRSLLFGDNNLEILLESAKTSFEGSVSGCLLVSNLDILVSMLGTKFDPIMSGDEDLILGLEETSRLTEDVRRYFGQVLSHQKASKIKAIILGRFVGIKSDDYPVWANEYSLIDIIKDQLRLWKNVPLIQWEEFGHSRSDLDNNIARKETFISLPNLSKCTLKVVGEEKKLILDKN